MIKKIIEVIKAILAKLKSFIIKVCSFVDMRDFFVFGGLIMTGYGIYLIYEPAAFIVCGSFLVCIGMGFFIRRPVK